VTAVIVATNEGPSLAGVLDALEGEVGPIVVVDNASTDGSVSSIEGRPGVSVVHNASNRGFAAAANQGAALAEGRWILFVNADIHLKPGDVQGLLAGVPDDVVAVAPLQVDQGGRPLVETGGYHPSLVRYLVWALVPARLNWRFGPWIAPPFPRRDMQLDWVSGALLGIRRSVFESLGGFSERFFLYQEDVDFGRRAREAGYRVICRPRVRLHHEVSHGDVQRRARQAALAMKSLATQFPGWRRRLLGIELWVAFRLRAALGRGSTRDLAEALLPVSRAIAAGRPLVDGKAEKGR
jgi:N-acetylglucosaminyl-diphospho-decaprenol L-rhamnosyltransferase